MSFVDWDPASARRASLDVLLRFGIAVAEHLPLLGHDDLDRQRPLGEVIQRTQALYAVLAVAEGGPVEAIHSSLVDRGLDRWLSSRERRFIDACRNGADSDQDRGELSWRMECMLALGWALGLFDDLPLTGTRVAPAEAFEPLDPKGFGAGPSPQVQLRPVEQLAERLDLFYCAHWAVREHELRRSFEPWPTDLVGAAIWERRHALEWIFDVDADDWDEMSLST